MQMNKYVRILFRLVNFALTVGFTYAAITPETTWMPRNPNWHDFGTIVMFAFMGAVIDYQFIDHKPKGPTDPKPPKGGRFA